tara:strand:- start:1092 stop:1982 length:891 start_codon:yes stop_codon:yes gene_type:complete
LKGSLIFNFKINSMKQICILFFIVCCCFFESNAQCTPNSIYQDSTYNIWPDTVTNLPVAYQGINYSAVLDIKTPATLLEATGGDSSILFLDTTVLGIQVSEFLGGWPVDSMELISLSGLPSGLNYGCNIPSCVLPGNILTCAYVNGLTNDNIGVYPISIIVNVYTHGTLDLGFIQYPYATDLYSALGNYEEIPGYKVVVSDATYIDLVHESKFSLMQNYPNPTSSSTKIIYNCSESQEVVFEVVDVFGNLVENRKFLSDKGLNSFVFEKNLSPGVYTYSITNNHERLSKNMIILDK